MASAVQIIVVDGPPGAGDVACRVLDQLESAWSRFVETSDISRLNHNTGQPLKVAPTTVKLVETMLEAWRMTGGLFDPSVLPALLEAGYVTSISDPTGYTSLPCRECSAHLDSFSFGHVTLDGDCLVTLPAGIAIDAGGLGKGLAADLVVAELLARGAAGALVSIGGDLAAAGRPPEAEGWRLDIEDPFRADQTVSQISFSGGGVATSSTRSRRWIHNNSEQHHVIDPRTDTPSESDLVAVTVIAPCGWQAEAHATALLLGGAIGFDQYVADNKIEAIATAIDGTTTTTNGFSELAPAHVMSS